MAKCLDSFKASSAVFSFFLKEKVHGGKASDAAQSQHFKAYALETGRNPKAEEINRQTLSGFEVLLGEVLFYTLMIVKNLGLLLGDQDNMQRPRTTLSVGTKIRGKSILKR